MSASRVWRVASTLEAPIDSLDRGAKPDSIDHGIVARGRPTIHPGPYGRLERDGGVRRDDAGVVDSIEADGISGSLVVIVPRELDGATAVILLAGCTWDTG